MLKHRSLLKAIIDFDQDKKQLPYIIENFKNLNSSGIVFNLDLHDKVYKYICDHASKFVDVPSYSRLVKYFEEQSEVKEELEKIAKEDALFSSNFKSLLEEVIDEQRKKELIELLKETSSISESGKKIKNGIIKGPKQAVEFFLHKSMSFLKSRGLVKTNGNLKGESNEALIDYYDTKNNKKFDGLFTTLNSIDSVCRGIRNTELWLIVAFVSELKTTLSMNFAYNQAIEQGMDVQFISLEMPYKQVRNLFITIHSANLNLWPGSVWDDVYPLNFDDIEEGILSEREEEFFNFLCKDLDTNPEYGNINIYQPEDGMSMAHLKAWAEIEYRKKQFDIIYLDYIELMKLENPNKEYTIELNQRIKDLKQFALNFNGGKGMRIVSAYQANRKGKEHADKSDGEYRLDALSYANEAERSADVIIYSYLNDELRDNCQAKLGCLKNRNRPKFKQFRVKTNLASRKVYESLDEANDCAQKSFKKNKNDKLKKEELINDIV